uniref:ZP domain-containing protein n=1 Tax=Globodera pallida TaxID=36090 RepID=A0A183BQ27_GLOPA
MQIVRTEVATMLSLRETPSGTTPTEKHLEETPSGTTPTETPEETPSGTPTEKHLEETPSGTTPTETHPEETPSGETVHSNTEEVTTQQPTVEVSESSTEEEIILFGSTGWGEFVPQMTTPWYEADEGMPKGSEGGEKTSFDGGVLEVRCVAPAGIRAILTPSTEFESANRSLISLFAKGFHEQRDCYAELDGRENIPLEIGEGQCGLSRVESTTPPGSNLSVVLIFASRRTLRLSPVEHSFLLQCFLPASPPPAVLNADLDTNAPPQPISHTISLEMTPPKCSYSLRRDSPNGPVVEKAHIGQTIYHRWECQGGKESNAAFGPIPCVPWQSQKVVVEDLS